MRPQRAIPAFRERMPESFELQTNGSTAQELPRDSTRNRQGVSRQNGDLPQYALRFVEHAQLSQYRPSVVIDFFPGKMVVVVEGVYTAERELDSSPRCRKTTPPAEVRAANQHFNKNGVVCDMAALDLDF